MADCSWFCDVASVMVLLLVSWLLKGVCVWVARNNGERTRERVFCGPQKHVRRQYRFFCGWSWIRIFIFISMCHVRIMKCTDWGRPFVSVHLRCGKWLAFKYNNSISTWIYIVWYIGYNVHYSWPMGRNVRPKDSTFPTKTEEQVLKSAVTTFLDHTTLLLGILGLRGCECGDVVSTTISTSEHQYQRIRSNQAQLKLWVPIQFFDNRKDKNLSNASFRPLAGRCLAWSHEKLRNPGRDYTLRVRI